MVLLLVVESLLRWVPAAVSSQGRFPASLPLVRFPPSTRAHRQATPKGFWSLALALEAAKGLPWLVPPPPHHESTPASLPVQRIGAKLVLLDASLTRQGSRR